MAREEYGDSISPYRNASIAALESLDTTDEPAGENRTEDEFEAKDEDMDVDEECSFETKAERL